MNIDGLKEFLKSIKETDIEVLKVESDDTQVYLRRGEVEPIVKVVEEGQNGEAIEKKEKRYAPIKSPMVGTFYHSESADRPPFVIAGNHIAPGQKIGLIEAMKIIKNVTSSQKGKIVKVLIENGQPVEYGQELFLIDTEDK